MNTLQGGNSIADSQGLKCHLTPYRTAKRPSLVSLSSIKMSQPRFYEDVLRRRSRLQSPLGCLIEKRDDNRRSPCERSTDDFQHTSWTHKPCRCSIVTWLQVRTAAFVYASASPDVCAQGCRPREPRSHPTWT